MSVAIIYAKSGGGKTVNSTLVPGTKLLLDSDNSSVVLANFERSELSVERIASVADFFEKYDRALKSGKYKTVIVDNATDLIDRWLLELGERGKNYGNPALQDYQTVYNGFKRLMRSAAMAGGDVILNFWQDSFTVTAPDGGQQTAISPKMPRRIVENICGLANIVAHIETGEKQEGGKYWYYRLEPADGVYAKDQLYCRRACLPENLFVNTIKEEK